MTPTLDLVREFLLTMFLFVVSCSAEIYVLMFLGDYAESTKLRSYVVTVQVLPSLLMPMIILSEYVALIIPWLSCTISSTTAAYESIVYLPEKKALKTSFVFFS